MKKILENILTVMFLLGIIGIPLILIVFIIAQINNLAHAQEFDTILAPDGSPTFVYPGASPNAPATIIGPDGQPSFLYPGTNGGPSTYQPPSAGQPSFIYPGTGRTSNGYADQPLTQRSSPGRGADPGYSSGRASGRR